MFSKTCEYAIRAMIYIAQRSKGGNRIGIKEIAKGIDSPKHFIAKVLQELSRKKLLRSLKGPNGGFYLDEETLQNSLADIVKVIDGDKLFTGCGLGFQECSETHPCPIHHEFRSIRKDIQAILENVRLAEFPEELGKNLTFLKR
jgi:Rrf2 family protein